MTLRWLSLIRGECKQMLLQDDLEVCAANEVVNTKLEKLCKHQTVVHGSSAATVEE